MTGQTASAPRSTTGERVTIADMSEALGLTKSTVSRALNGYTDIAEGTRRRVERMASKMGYIPLSHAQAIKTGRTRSLGFVIQNADHDAHRPFLAEFLAGISQAASAEGWTLTVAASESEADTLETMRSLWRDRKADGFILPRSMVDDDRVTALQMARIPFVLFGRTKMTDSCAWFDYLGEEAMHRAVLHLVGLGHRRIAYVGGGNRYYYAGLRRAGFLSAMAEAGLEADPRLMTEDAVTITDGDEAARRLLSATDQPPTAFVCAVDMAALGLYRMAADLGLVIGRDLSVIAYDGVPEGAVATPPLSTFAADARHAGEMLASFLIRHVRGEEIATLQRAEPATFLDRGSAAAPALTTEALAVALQRRMAHDKPNPTEETE